MKVKLETLIIYGLMGALTLGYTCLIRLGLSIFNILYDPKMGELSLLSRVTAELAVVEIWQTLAWASLVVSLVWGLIRAKHGDNPNPHAAPWIYHICWILMSFFWNVVGALDPFIMSAYVIR